MCGKVVCRWGVIFVKRGWYPVRQVRIDEVGDVLLLFEQDAVCVGGDVNVKKVRNWPLIFDIPASRKCRSE
eukprot:1379242-Pleurochrysis_carterae.AAC.1